MTLLEVEELIAYWVEHPPVHIALAALLRGGHPRMPPDRPGVEAALAALGAGFAKRDVGEGLPPVTLDFARLKRAAERGTPG